MRTTVELSDPVYRRLKSEAVERGVRGFSPIVEEALSEYFRSGPARRRLVEAIRDAEGAWTEAESAQWERDVEEAWSSWRLPPS